MAGEKVAVRVPCDRCGGRGGIECFRRVQAGVCFKCRGSSVMVKTVTETTARKWRERYPDLNPQQSRPDTGPAAPS